MGHYAWTGVSVSVKICARGQHPKTEKVFKTLQTGIFTTLAQCWVVFKTLWDAKKWVFKTLQKQYFATLQS